MSRKAHILNTGKVKQRPSLVIYMDSESRVDEKTLIHTPYLVCASFCRYTKAKKYKKEKDYIGMENIPIFWDDVCTYAKEKATVQVYAHNMSYDAINTGAIPSLEKNGFRLMSFFEKGGTYIYKYVSIKKIVNEEGKEEELPETRRTIYLLSSTNFYAQKLSEIGKVFGTNKINIEEEFKEDYNTIPVEKALIYCRQDVYIVEIAMEAMFDFVYNEELGTMGKTAASQAFNAFRFRFMEHDIYIHTNEKAIDLERASYYGGRVECWHIGHLKDDDFYYCDVNSMYPYVMRTFSFPVRLINFSRFNDLDDIINSLAHGEGVIAHVKIKTDSPYFPMRYDGKLIFPVGEYATYLATYELEFAIKHNLIIEVMECSYYEMQPIFKTFVDYFYNKRMDAKKAKDSIHTYLFKLIMNCLYGKFGQLSENWDRVGDYELGIARNEEVIDEEGIRHEYKILSGSLFEKKDTEESFNSFPAIAAHVTSAARMHLLKHILIAEKENVLYMDTDSLFCNSVGYENLKPYLDEYELGKMKIENTGTEVIINAPKDYIFYGEELMRKRKGISKDARPLSLIEYLAYIEEQRRRLSKAKFAEFLKTLKKEELTVNMQWGKMNSFIRENKVDEFHNVLRIKKLARTYNKGIVQKNGVVQPFTFPLII